MVGFSQSIPFATHDWHILGRLTEIQSGMTFLRKSSRSSLLVEHDLFQKPVPTFRDHALTILALHHPHSILRPAALIIGVRRTCSSVTNFRARSGLESGTGSRPVSRSAFWNC